MVEPAGVASLRRFSGGRILSRAAAKALHELDAGRPNEAKAALEQGRELAEAAFLADAVGYNDPELARQIREEIMKLPDTLIP